MATERSKFDPDKLRELDLFGFGHDEPQEPDPIESADKLLRHLREWHRELSEQIVSVNREMGHVAAGGNLNSPEVLALREQAQQLRDKRAEVEAEIEAEAKQLKALLQDQQKQGGDVSQPVPSAASDKAGLIRVRHRYRVRVDACSHVRRFAQIQTRRSRSRRANLG